MNKNTNDHYLILFASCVVVKGVKRGAIYDLQNNNIYPVPLDLTEFIEDSKVLLLKDVYTKYGVDNAETINEYIEFLMQKSLAFFTKEPHLYPDIERKWNFPSKISNAIIDINNQSKHNFKKIFTELSALNCKAVQLRFFDLVEDTELDNILTLTLRKGFYHIDILLKDHGYTIERINMLGKITKNISSITLHSSKKNEQVLKSEHLKVSIIKTTKNIDSCTHCGVIKEKNFTANIPFFTESIHSNSCLNRKISIDVKGEIKNCPSMKYSYGDSSSNSLLDVSQLNTFQDLWSLNKDKVTICQDCEFRYACLDCRAYLENKFDKPKKCDYDPYQAKWLKK